MEIKKSPKADLQNKRGLLLEIGLIIALGGVIAAFAWTPKEQKIEKLDLNIAPVEEEIMEICTPAQRLSSRMRFAQQALPSIRLFHPN